MLGSRLLLPKPPDGHHARIRTPFCNVQPSDLQQNIAIANASTIAWTICCNVRDERVALLIGRSENSSQAIVGIVQRHFWSLSGVNKLVLAVNREIQPSESIDAQGRSVIRF